VVVWDFFQQYHDLQCQCWTNFSRSQVISVSDIVSFVSAPRLVRFYSKKGWQSKLSKRPIVVKQWDHKLFFRGAHFIQSPSLIQLYSCQNNQCIKHCVICIRPCREYSKCSKLYVFFLFHPFRNRSPCRRLAMSSFRAACKAASCKSKWNFQTASILIQCCESESSKSTLTTTFSMAYETWSFMNLASTSSDLKT